MSIVFTWNTDAGLDGVTNVSATSKYARASEDDHAYEGDTDEGTKLDPIGLISPRASVGKASGDLGVASLLSTASATQRDHATTVDDYIAFNVQVVTANVVADLEGQVVNLVTGVIVELLTFTEIKAGEAFTSRCVMVPTGHAIRLFATAAGASRVTIVLEPTDDPSDFATLCCCPKGANGNGDGGDDSLIFGCAQMPGSPATRFLVPGSAPVAPIGIRRLCPPRPGTLTSLCVQIDGPAVAGAQILTYEVLKNAAPTGIAVPVVVTGTQGSATGFAVPIVLSDRVALRVPKSGAHPLVTGITALVGYAA